LKPATFALRRIGFRRIGLHGRIIPDRGPSAILRQMKFLATKRGGRADTAAD
jgi:hypothetical protein